MTEIDDAVPATPSDLASWMELAREVQPLFGPMPDFSMHATRGMARGTALVVRSAEGAVLGAALLSRESPVRTIRWLAVRKTARRLGVGARLVEEILHRWPPPGDIHVVTFGPDVEGGSAARQMYERFGFRPGLHVEPTADSTSRQEFVLAQPPT
ncbi:MAG: GNAT family N-acetyltransferase [Propionibacteriales bacterium]|nr:GNAT family N-acetyltransferase [Propionibacteriales bacterium]